MRIGFVTTAEVGGITPDDRLIADALEERGAQVVPMLWDANDIRTDVDGIVLRSPWNYHFEPERFLAWTERADRSAFFYNEPCIVRWNIHKRYLFEIRDAGVPIPETVLCTANATWDLRTIVSERGWKLAVVKPAVSASSFMTSIVGPAGRTAPHNDAIRGRLLEDGQHLLDNILQTRDALIQPFMPEILERGERSLVFIDGAFSHAVQKAPFTSSSGSGKPAEAEAREVDLAERALAILPETPLYARVDLLRGADGVDYLMEMELIDPELYARFAPSMPARFAAALLRRLGRAREAIL